MLPGGGPVHPVARRHRLVVVAVLALASLAAACGDDGSPAATTAAPGSVPTTTAVIPTNPDAYATAFVLAWAGGDRATAEVLGTADAVSTIFAEDPGSGPWTLTGCDGAAGSSYCTATSGTSSIVVRVGNEKATLGQPQAVDEVRVGG
jgi:hypothetical protein